MIFKQYLSVVFYADLAFLGEFMKFNSQVQFETLRFIQTERSIYG